MDTPPANPTHAALVGQAVKAADAVICSVDRALQPETELPIMTSCSGLSRLRTSDS
jgi:hypothetical protein